MKPDIIVGSRITDGRYLYEVTDVRNEIKTAFEFYTIWCIKIIQFEDEGSPEEREFVQIPGGDRWYRVTYNKFNEPKVFSKPIKLTLEK